jgi:hypothetical protein
MRRISLALVTLVLGMMSLSSFSLAADQYTYRAGQAYMKTAASNFGECEAQCRGDAACRGWNFIRPNPRSRSGICEFNARLAAPISSPISISGTINTSIDMAMSRAVPIARGNTVRVGTPIVPKRVVRQAVVHRPINAPQMMSAPANVQKRVVRKLPVDNVIRAPIPVGYRPISQAQIRPLTGPVKPRSMTRQQIFNEQRLAAQKRADAQANAKIQQAQYRAIAAPRPPQQFVPIMKQLPRAPRAPRPPKIPAAAPNQQSLYGSLYDDLTQNMTSVPRPQTAPEQLDNPDAPLATNRPIPVIPVQASPLGYPVVPGPQLQRLAGG